MRLSLFATALAVSAFAASVNAQVSGTAPHVKLTTTPRTAGSHSSFLVNGSDNCANAAASDAISGLGTFPMSNSGATTGSPVANCGAMGLDVWFYWTSTVTSNVTVKACGGTTADTVFAVWADGSPAGSCPTTQLVCNDDTCGLQSQVTFAATSGASYFIEIGAFAGGSTFTGTFDISVPQPCPSGCTIDDGTADNSVGWTAGGTFLWINRFGSPSATTTVSSVSGCYGTPLFPGFVPPAGTPVTYAVWSNPANDGNAANTTLVSQVNTTVAAASIDSNVFQVVPLPSAVTLNGYFFVGCALAHNSGQYVGPLDQGGNPCVGMSDSWYCGLNGTGAINLTNLSANQYPPATIDSAGLPGIWLLRAGCSGATGTPYCFGDGTGTACPCANNGAAGNGCANSVNPAGANLAGTGVASVGADTLVLHGIGMPSSSALYFQGTTQISVAFGDGLRCAGGAVIRLGVKFNSGTGTSQYPEAGDQSVSQRGLVPAAGGTFDYQCWYRNGAAFCTASTFNLSNGLQVVWAP